MPTTSKERADAKTAIQDAAEPAVRAAESASAMFETALAAPLELSRFYARRMSRDLETMAAMTRCRTPAELMGVWTEAAQAAAEDYQEEAGRMLGLVAGAADGGSRGRKSGGRGS